MAPEAISDDRYRPHGHIVMPERDGYQTMEVMRRNAAFRRLPIIALAANAMKGDRENCRRASVSDALAKPVIAEQLLSDLRIWCTVRRA
jgi:CheY-like chemotaxis protein